MGHLIKFRMPKTDDPCHVNPDLICLAEIGGVGCTRLTMASGRQLVVVGEVNDIAVAINTARLGPVR